MTTDQDLPMDGQSTTAAFAAKGIDVTPNKDQGVIKVFIVFFLKFYFKHSSTSLTHCFMTCSCFFCLDLTASISSTLSVKKVCLLNWKLVSPIHRL